MLETIGSLDEMTEAVGAAREACDLPIVASMTFAEDGRTIGGSSPEEVAARLYELGVAAIGATARLDRSGYCRSRRRWSVTWASGTEPSRRSPACPTPAGPRMSRARHLPSSPEYFAGLARRAAEAGVRIIGGCCGTTPLHTAAMREALDAWTAERGDGVTSRSTLTSPHASRRTRILAAPELDLVPAEGPTRLREKLDRGEFVVSVEIDPPKGLNPTKALDGACLLQEAGVDFINVADSPMARVRMSALTMCYLIQHRTGMETILHFTTRDRSLMGLQSELLGAHAVGVRNIIALTGDPPSLGDYPDSSAVYDVDSIGLIRILDRLNTGADSAGRRSGGRRVHHRLRR